LTSSEKQRQVVEHRIARMTQLGVRQARYFGRHKTLFQVLMAATVANLTLVMGRTRGQGASGASLQGLQVPSQRPAQGTVAAPAAAWALWRPRNPVAHRQLHRALVSMVTLKMAHSQPRL
jgi:hypothetical protein